MKFVQRDLGEAAEASSGGGGKGMTREILTLSGAMLALLIVVYFGIGFLVEWTLPWVSVEREQRWFGGMYANDDMGIVVEENGGRLEDARRVLDKLLAVEEAPPISFQLILLEDSDPNAFAIPGGRIAITTGLLEVIEDNEIALAFVLGHELGHFMQRDHLRGLGRSIGRGLIWALIFGGSGGIDLISERTNQLLDLGHSREQESGADREGFLLVMQSYGTAEGSERLFEWLAEQSNQPRWLSVLESHPPPADRVEKLRGWAMEFKSRNE